MALGSTQSWGSEISMFYFHIRYNGIDNVMHDTHYKQIQQCKSIFRYTALLKSNATKYLTVGNNELFNGPLM